MRLVSPDKTVPIPVNKIITLTKGGREQANRPGQRRHGRPELTSASRREPQPQRRASGLRFSASFLDLAFGHLHGAGDGAGARMPSSRSRALSAPRFFR